jgi:hypothetical protein
MSKEIASRDVTEIADFEPTDKMQEYLNTAVQLLTDSPGKIERECDVTRKSWYYWLKTVDGFENWFYSEYKKRRARILPKLDEIGMQFAKRGSYQHWEAMNKKVGELVDEVNNNVMNQTQVVIMFDSDLAGKYGVTPSPEKNSD